MLALNSSFLRRRRRAGLCHGGRAIGVGVIAALIQACASAPAVEPPLAPLAIPEQFSASGSAVLPVQWWRLFDDTTLNRLQAQALSDNFSLAAARARLRQAEALAQQLGAARSPNLEASARASTERDQDSAPGELYGLGLTAGYEVDLWGRIEAAIRAAKAERVAIAADLQTAAMTLTAELASTYFQWLQQRAAIDLLLAQEITNRQIAELIRLRVLNGQAGLDELLRQQQLVAQSEGQLLQARFEAELLTQQLAVLTGQTPDAPLLLEPSAEIELPPLPSTGIPSLWLRQRPDLVAAYARLAAADAEVAQAVSAQYPRLDLMASLEAVATRPSTLIENWLATLAASLSAPLLDGGSLRSEVEQAVARRDLALANYRQTLLDSLADVETALLAEQRDERLLESLEAQLELARAALEQLTFRYRNGATDYLNVLSTLTSVQSLQRERLALRYQQLQDRIALSRALAGAWTDLPPAGELPALIPGQPSPADPLRD